MNNIYKTNRFRKIFIIFLLNNRKYVLICSDFIKIVPLIMSFYMQEIATYFIRKCLNEYQVEILSKCETCMQSF